MELRNILSILLVLSSSRGLKLGRLMVPSVADVRLPVTLSCEYDLEGHTLYSVKWYKDEQEFFRYMPEYPYSMAFHVPGLTVDNSTCDMHTVRLVNLSFESSGNYKCEVSTEAPYFATVFVSSNMTVMAFPEEDPVIQGILPTYSLEDFVSANCTSPRSKPATTLEWYINDVKAISSMWEYPMHIDDNGLYTKKIGLQFQVNRDHFKGRNPTMEIRCTAYLLHVARNTTMSAELVTVTNQMLSQERVPSSSASTGARGLKVADLMMPSVADVSSAVTLTCDYDLQGDNLYSVNWYKDEQEFFRYMPEYPYSMAFDVPGLTVDSSSCDMHIVRLVNLSFESSGWYTCDVCTEGPRFMCVGVSSNMIVMAFPVEDPVIEGILPTYSLEDFVSANCTSPRSKPATTLEWYINDVKAISSMWEYPTHIDDNSFYTKKIGLQFQVNRDHFKGRSPTMEIRCTAYLLHVTRNATMSAELVTVTNQMLSQEPVPSSSVSTSEI